MEKLNPQDAGFLKLESPHCPFHVAGLMILKQPPNAPRNFIRSLAKRCEQLPERWPVFRNKLSNPLDINKAAWVVDDDFSPERHVSHYALPQPGRMDDLMQLVTRVHERPLDRGRPLWELHVIEGLPGGRFAMYCKVHHALVDGVGAMKMIQGMFSTSPSARLKFSAIEDHAGVHHEHHSLFDDINGVGRGLMRQYKAIPELSSLLAHMSADAFLGKADSMPLPFTAPRTVFNTELDSRRSIVICDLPLNRVRGIAKKMHGSINDVLLAICGGAIRDYLKENGTLPKKSLVAGIPISLKSGNDAAGNKLSYIMSPFFTEEPNPLRRLKRVIAVTGKAKAEVARLSTTASLDYYALIMAPTILLTVTGNATRVRPATNAIFSNVPGSQKKLYLNGAELETIYPLSIVTDGMGLNITVVSHVNKLCFAIVACPTEQPDVSQLGPLLKKNYQKLREAIASA